jgi:putative endonuclease
MSDDAITQPKHLQVGQEGERRAIEALQKRGFALVATNWHCAAGELDAVMWDGQELAFVEVKVRTGSSRGSAEEALTASKARKLALAAEWFLAEHPELGDPIWRIDLVAITLDHRGQPVRFSHIANAALPE